MDRLDVLVAVETARVERQHVINLVPPGIKIFPADPARAIAPFQYHERMNILNEQTKRIAPLAAMNHNGLPSQHKAIGCTPLTLPLALPFWVRRVCARELPTPRQIGSAHGPGTFRVRPTPLSLVLSNAGLAPRSRSVVQQIERSLRLR